MSIENTLERIATALEKIAAGKGSSQPDVGLVALEEPVKKTATKVKKDAPPAAAATTAAPVEITKAQVEEVLKKYASKKGIPSTKELIVKHGANKETPTIASIPVGNYQEVINAVNEALAQG